MGFRFCVGLFWVLGWALWVVGLCEFAVGWWFSVGVVVDASVWFVGLDG